MTNILYYGDNLPILRSMPANSVDLVYLDPPFNSSRSYNVLLRDESGSSSDAQIDILVYELYRLTDKEIRPV